MAVIGVVVWAGLALLVAFGARRLLYVLMGWQTLRVARWREHRGREALR